MGGLIGHMFLVGLPIGFDREKDRVALNFFRP